MPKSRVNFPEPRELGPRQWGREVLHLHVEGKYTLKCINMIKGAKGGLQYHHKKDEGGIVIFGRMLVRFDDGYGNLVERVCCAGDAFHFPPRSVHQAEALTDVVYVEVSTPHFNDRVHVEDKYGIEAEAGGLPSTRLEDVIEA